MAPKVPYVIGVAGSVAVGKSTFARILQALLALADHPKVDLSPPTGSCSPTLCSSSAGIMNRKGFPESYDTRRLLRFLRDQERGSRCGRPRLQPRRVRHRARLRRLVRQPDIIILEGLNVLRSRLEESEFVSDYFDFSIYVDADEADVERVVHRSAS